MIKLKTFLRYVSISNLTKKQLIALNEQLIESNRRLNDELKVIKKTNGDSK